MKRLLSIAALALSAVLCSSAWATPVGPSYPAPGGNSFAGNGVNGANGEAIWNFSGFDGSAFSELYYGLNQVDFGLTGAGLYYEATPLTFAGVSGETATWTATTTYADAVTGVLRNASTRLVMQVTGLGANPWITDLASIGLDVGFGPLGAVVDNSAAGDFTLKWKFEADIGSGWQALNSVSQQLVNDGATRSSFATGFYAVAPVSVPAPSSLLLLALGLLTLARYPRIKA